MSEYVASVWHLRFGLLTASLALGHCLDHRISLRAQTSAHTDATLASTQIIARIERRISHISFLPVENGEGLQASAVCNLSVRACPTAFPSLTMVHPHDTLQPVTAAAPLCVSAQV